MQCLLAPHRVALLTLRRSVPVMELHALQGAMTAHATEAVGVEEFVHGPHCRLGAGQRLATLPTDLYIRNREAKRRRVGKSKIYKQIHQEIHLHTHYTHHAHYSVIP